MSARISMMYKRSGGCDRENVCGKCEYYVKRENRCKMHRVFTGEEDAEWDKAWMACKHFIRRGSPKYMAEKSGQLRLF